MRDVDRDPMSLAVVGVAIATIILVAFLLAGCVTTSGQGDVSNVCEALGANADANGNGAIKYNSHKVSSPRHAGPALAPDMATRNKIGIQLHCPGF
jgi:predicted small secreted protein